MQTHQNVALCLRVLRSQGVQQSPDRSIKKETSEFLAVKIDTLSNDTVTFQVRKQVEEAGPHVLMYKDTIIKKPTLVEETVPKSKSKEDFLESLDSFIQHSERVRTQYDNLAILKETLTKTECTVQVDFAENYVCHYLEEINNAYYSKEQLTVHPAVIHYKGVNGELKHKSLVVLSDEMAHTVATVFVFLKVIVGWIKQNLAHIQQIHYMSYSPTSQYRNGTIFNLVSLHKAMFGIPASWQYFESGHGKGPCDGVGGSDKTGS